MLGTIVNTITILVGTAIGATAKRGIKEQYSTGVFVALGLCTVALGLKASITGLMHSEYPVLFIVSMAIGALVGTALQIDRRVNELISRKGSKNLAEGLTTACLLYCIGTFSIVGSVLSALQGDNTFLFTNATLDLVTATIFAASYGWGMLLAAPILFCWQGAIYLLAKTAGPVVSDALICELTIVGGLLILSSGLAILKIKDCKTLNLLPALAIPPIFFLLRHWVDILLLG